MAFTPKFLSNLTSTPEQRAEAFLKAGDKAKAAEAYAKAGLHPQAAKLFAETGNSRRAVETTLVGVLGKVPDGYSDATPLQAGELLASSGHHKEAIVLFELGADWKQAAESAAKLQLHAKAARFYEKARLWKLAANYYRRGNQPGDAARALEQESNRLKTEGRARREPGIEQAIAEIDQERAELLGKLGKSGEAATLLSNTMPTLKSGKLLEAAGRFEEAIQAYVAVGEKEDALRLLPKATGMRPHERAKTLLACGKPQEAAALFAASGAFKECAQAWEAAAVWPQAGRAWEEAREPRLAAEAYRKAGRWADAGRSFLAAGDDAAAGEAFLNARDYQRAGESLLKAGKPFEAATCFLEVQSKDDASRALRQVPAASQIGGKATMLLVPLLYEQGKYTDALQRLQMLPPATDPGGTTIVDQLYWQARLLERLERTAEAIAAYQKLVAIKPGYKDAAERLGGLRVATGRMPVAQAPAASPLPGARSTEAAPVLSRPAGQGGFPAGYLLAGRYEIVAEIGRGGMGRVYRARDRELAEEVAIKTILGRSDQDAEIAAEQDRLLREVQLLRRLTHPNIVRVYDLGRFPDGIFVTMELVAGQTLDQVVRSKVLPPLDRLRAILKQIAAGLGEAHAHSIVHRDLKPSNVILTPTRVKILDFGIARTLSGDTRLTMTGLAVGTPMYMSPEQIQGADLDGRCDLYALGVVAFTLLAGREPFLGNNPTAIALEHLQSPPPDLRRLRPGTPEPWVVFVERLLAKAPDARYADAAAVGDALDALPV
ncbi:MAG: protein kinase [Thermoanaerobaculia bacterium]|nr:protein kinase [Thermoanaerobaculia bacterium]